MSRRDERAVLLNEQVAEGMRLRRENDELRARISQLGGFVSHEHYAALQLERDQLAARVGELGSELNDWVTGYGSCGCGHPSCRIERDAAVGRGILNRSNPASLARHDAELLRKFGAKFVERYASAGIPNELITARIAEGWLNDQADRIEQESDK